MRTEKQITREEQQKNKLTSLGYNLERLNNLNTFQILDEFQMLVFFLVMEEKDKKNIKNYSESEQLQKNVELINSVKLRLIKSITNI